MAKLIELSCPCCGRNLTASSAERSTRCIQCGELLLLTDQPDPLPEESRIQPPTDVKVTQGKGCIRMSYTWFKWDYFPVFWSIGILTIIPVFFFTFAWRDFLPEWLWLWRGLNSLDVMAVLLLGFWLSQIAHRTVVELSETEMSVWYEPLPWFGEMTISCDELQRLAGVKKKFLSYNTKGGERVTYYVHHLYAFRKNSTDSFRLLSYLPSSEASVFIKQVIEDWLSLNQDKK